MQVEILGHKVYKYLLSVYVGFIVGLQGLGIYFFYFISVKREKNITLPQIRFSVYE